jgi:hypothetical protein
MDWFEYRDEMLVRINHQISIPDGADGIPASQQSLAAFWELLNYRRGTLVRIAGAHGRPVDPTSGDRARLIALRGRHQDLALGCIS